MTTHMYLEPRRNWVAVSKKDAEEEEVRLEGACTISHTHIHTEVRVCALGQSLCAAKPSCARSFAQLRYGHEKTASYRW